MIHINSLLSIFVRLVRFFINLYLIMIIWGSEDTPLFGVIPCFACRALYPQPHYFFITGVGFLFFYAYLR